MKKEFAVLIGLLLLINFVSAINLEVRSTPVSNAVIKELNKPAMFDLKITNLGEEDNFEIYSLVGVDISPSESIFIGDGETKTVRVTVMPQKHILNSNSGYFAFEYKIKNSQNEAQKDKFTINILDLSNAVSIIPESINPSSSSTIIQIKNNADYDFENLKLNIVSIFFDVEETIDLKGSEVKTIEVTLDRDRMKVSEAGDYLVNTQINVEGEKADAESIIKFLEKEGIETTREEEGWLIKRTAIEKSNVGNVYQVAQINVDRSVFAYLFTTFNIAPETDFHGLSVSYNWQKDLIPGEKMNVIVKTNWLWPLIVGIFAVLIFITVKRYVESDLVFSKNVSFIKTRGGEFALKVSLRLKAKEFVENIHIIDKLPHIVSLYDKFGAIYPDKIDLKNRRLEWNVESLNKGEEKIFSYIIYSKMGVVGRFELPSGKAIYEKEGKIKETASNRSFYINEPKEPVKSI